MQSVIDALLDFTSLISGVISSILAVLLVEIYFGLKRKYEHHRLKQIIDFRNKSCIIITSIHHQQTSAGTIHFQDAYAFSYVFDLCNRLGKNVEFVPYHRATELMEPLDVICIGGPHSNKITSYYLEKYCPNFSFDYQTGSLEKESDIKKGKGYRGPVTGFTCGNQQYLVNSDIELGLLFKITSDELEQERTVHLIFGCSGIGTGGAAYYLWRYYPLLHQEFGNGKYAIAIKIRRNEGYKSVLKKFIDLTSTAFATL